jgi:hypothetical protein
MPRQTEVPPTLQISAWLLRHSGRVLHQRNLPERRAQMQRFGQSQIRQRGVPRINSNFLTWPCDVDSTREGLPVSKSKCIAPVREATDKP